MCQLHALDTGALAQRRQSSLLQFAWWLLLPVDVLRPQLWLMGVCCAALPAGMAASAGAVAAAGAAQTGLMVVAAALVGAATVRGPAALSGRVTMCRTGTEGTSSVSSLACAACSPDTATMCGCHGCTDGLVVGAWWCLDALMCLLTGLVSSCARIALLALRCCLAMLAMLATLPVLWGSGFAHRCCCWCALLPSDQRRHW